MFREPGDQVAVLDQKGGGSYRFGAGNVMPLGCVGADSRHYLQNGRRLPEGERRKIGGNGTGVPAKSAPIPARFRSPRNPHPDCHIGSRPAVCANRARAFQRRTEQPSRRIGLDLMLAFPAPNDQPDAGGGSVAERHRWAAVGFHLPCGLGLGEITDDQLR